MAVTAGPSGEDSGLGKHNASHSGGEAHSADDLIDHAYLDAGDIARLRARLGKARLRQRLNAQLYHVAGEAHQDLTLFGWFKLPAVDVVVERLARLLGIYSWGYRGFTAIRLVEHEIRHPRLPAALDGLRLLQLTDLHLDLDPAIGSAIKERLAGVEYDLAVITGDFRNTTVADHGPSVVEMLSLLEVLERPAFAVPGNHDFIEIVPPLERAGLRFLLNEAVSIPFRGERLYLAGVDDPHYYRTHDLAGVRDQIPDDGFSVLLCHSPETYREAAGHGFDVMLCGHTHGGQICLPGGIPLVRVCDAPKPMLAGSWQYRELIGYTSVGTGSCGVPLRYFCPPEITLHRLVRG
jgi:predicted MPP superfamily phosphohydrolase